MARSTRRRGGPPRRPPLPQLLPPPVWDPGGVTFYYGPNGPVMLKTTRGAAHSFGPGRGDGGAGESARCKGLFCEGDRRKQNAWNYMTQVTLDALPEQMLLLTLRVFPPAHPETMPRRVALISVV